MMHLVVQLWWLLLPEWGFFPPPLHVSACLRCVLAIFFMETWQSHERSCERMPFTNAWINAFTGIWRVCPKIWRSLWTIVHRTCSRTKKRACGRCTVNPPSSHLVLYSLAPLVPPSHLFTVQTQFGETATTQNADFWQVVLVIGVNRFSFPIWSLISSLCQHLISPYFQPAAVPPPLLLPAGGAQPCKSHSCIDPAAAVQNRCLHRECARPAPLSCTGRLYTPV